MLLLNELLASIRNLGWMVAAHNDYRQDGKLMTFWLFTRDGVCVKGEAETDYDALLQVERQTIRAAPAELRTPRGMSKKAGG